MAKLKSARMARAYHTHLLVTLLFILLPSVLCNAPHGHSHGHRHAHHARAEGLDASEDSLLSNLTDTTLSRRQTTGTSANTDDTYSCGPGNPCSNGACCGESGYCGFGPTYCGTGCTSNCNAHADCGQYAATPGKTCPLNVCCSQFGFCGTTSDFCGTECQSNCGSPARPGGSGDVRDWIMGYWESWKSDSGSCGDMSPSQIPASALDAVNFAFASVDPSSFEIVPMPGDSVDQFSQLTAIKASAPDTKFYISIGGWSFNDNNTNTQTVFSTIASSAANRDKFAKNIFKFTNQYGFDGVDIDWEYPGAPDRGGSPKDVENFPLMIEAIASLYHPVFSTPKVSITVPTSYWYLRWFDLQALGQYVEFFNLMSYDLHGVWDSTDPIGPHVYAHTNLTEIDLALDLFWRNKVSPGKINLGLAFYGRSFELSDPSCITPGCGFSGPGAQGSCTKTAGILSYREIQNLIAEDGFGKYENVYDPVAAVNYFVYDQKNWVSYDTKESWQAKIDYANSVGLRGLFIWAIDQDDDSLDALKAVTGKDITPRTALSKTLGSFEPSMCLITKPYQSCPSGYTQMTSLNLDSTGTGCPKSDHKCRALCCPSWGAPDPSTCSWHGTASECYGQCAPGEVGFATDNYGGGKKCNHGVKQFCCPATGNAAVIAACGPQKSCSGATPQKIANWGTGKLTHKQEDYCCPANPVWKNCSWHGSNFNCAGNHCPNGQVEMARNNFGDGGSISTACMLGRQHALCCDPAFGDTSGAFLPVELDWLFPETLPTGDQPDYFESFDQNVDQQPKATFMAGGEDPQKASFAWTVIVGPEGSYQSLTKRDGSQLETFDCPSPAEDDYRAQKLKAVCMADGDDHNCEAINIDGAHGTIVKLPDECGPDTYVRVISFRRTERYDLPDHLAKRTPTSPRVYELRYDYNLRKLNRRDDSDVYVRLDVSNHPGYWNEIVNTKPDGSKRKREANRDWRAEQMSWFEDQLDNGLQKRGYSSTSQWWLDRFNDLISGGSTKIGLNKDIPFNQVLYSATKGCAPNANAQLEALIYGSAKFDMDFGITLIGSLTNFGFQEAYAYFDFQGMTIIANASLIANAGVAFQSPLTSILENYPPFGANYNLKGLFTLGPYFDVKAQLQAQATMSGAVTGVASMTVPGGYTFMLPQGLGPDPSKDQFSFYLQPPYVSAGIETDISSKGSISVSMIPAVGFKLELDFGGSQLVNTDIRFAFTNTLVTQIGASSGSECHGAEYGLDWDTRVDFTIANPFVLWGSGETHWTPYKYTAQIQPVKCWDWTGSTPQRRSLDDPNFYASNASDTSDASMSIYRRQGPIAQPPLIDSEPLFPDTFGSALSCPGGRNSSTGDCHVSVADYGSDPSDSGAIGKRSYLDDYEGEVFDVNVSEPTYHHLEERDSKKTIQYCAGKAVGNFISPQFPSSGKLIKDIGITYGPTNPSNCNDYGFGSVNTPAPEDSEYWATEHVLEFQEVPIFLDWVFQFPAQSYPYPAATGARPKPAAADDTGANTYEFCKYFKFWWGTSGTGQPINQVANAFPGTNTRFQELVLLDYQTNNLKEAIWGTNGNIRVPTDMQDYVDNDVNKAINTCKVVMQVFQYHNLANVQTILLDQATRVGAAFDNVENTLVTFSNPAYAATPYQRLNIGDAWRAWIKDRNNNYAAARARAFLDTWITKIVNAHLPPDDEDSDGDTNMSSQGSDVQHNPVIVARVQALQAAHAALPAWPDPFPANW